MGRIPVADAQDACTIGEDVAGRTRRALRIGKAIMPDGSVNGSGYGRHVTPTGWSGWSLIFCVPFSIQVNGRTLDGDTASVEVNRRTGRLQVEGLIGLDGHRTQSLNSGGRFGFDG